MAIHVLRRHFPARVASVIICGVVMTHRLALVVGFGLCLFGCGDASQDGAAPGEPCQMLGTDLECHASATLCYSAGFASSCADGNLCIGNGSGMACAYRCKQTSDCTATSATAICMQDCGLRSLNGSCVEPDAHSRLLGMSCSTAGSATTSGVVN
jgi:hypothetical protein